MYCDIYIKLSSVYGTTVIEDDCNLYKERKIFRNIFVGNILSKILKWILGPQKTLICNEDTKKSHTTIH